MSRVACRFLSSCWVVVAVFLSMSVSALAGPVTTDQWDIHQGTTVTATSPVLKGWASDGRDLFGGTYSAIEPSSLIFDDFYPDGTVHWIEWQTATPVVTGNLQLYGASDGAVGRQFRTFRLYAWNSSTGSYELVYTYSPSIPYSPGLIVAATVTPFCAQKFRAEFVQNGYVEWASVTRLYELDGFAPIPEPGSLALLALAITSFGGIAVLRRK